MPASDVGNSRHPGGNAIWDQCTKILGDAGIPREVSGIYTVGRCDALLFWKTVLERASSWTLAGIRASVEALGKTYQSGYTLTTAFGPGRHDGATGYRIAAFDDGLKRFKYTSETRPAP